MDVVSWQGADPAPSAALTLDLALGHESPKSREDFEQRFAQLVCDRVTCPPLLGDNLPELFQDFVIQVCLIPSGESDGSRRIRVAEPDDLHRRTGGN